MPKLLPGTGFGLIFVAAGLGMMVAMAVDTDGLNVPLWVAECAAACFALAGGSIIAQAYSKLRLSRAFSLGVVYTLAVPGLWIAFGPGGDSCSASAGLGPFSFGLPDSLVSCRLAFGAGAIVTIICAVAMTYAVLKPGSAPEKTPPVGE